MLKQVLKQTKFRFLTGLLFLSMWLVFAQPAEAEKAAKALTFSPAGGGVEVLALYETSYAAQKSVVKSLKVPTKLMKKAIGFQGASMLRSQDGKQVIALSQWQDLASYQSYTPPATMSASASPSPAQTLLFEVAAVQTSFPGATPALRGKEAVVQLTQLAPKMAEDRSQILAQAEAMLPNLLAQQPIPQSVLLLRGIAPDQADAIALMQNWNCSALFEDVGQPKAIELSSDLAAIANSTQQLYSVVNLIPGESQKPEEEED